MINFTARVTTSDGDRPLALDTLRRLLEPTRVLPGCACCCLFQDTENPNRIAFVERWEDEASMVRRIRSRDFKLILAVIDMSVEQPEVRFDWIMRVRGLDYIEQTLSTVIESEASQ